MKLYEHYIYILSKFYLKTWLKVIRPQYDKVKRSSSVSIDKQTYYLSKLSDFQKISTISFHWFPDRTTDKHVDKTK